MLNAVPRTLPPNRSARYSSQCAQCAAPYRAPYFGVRRSAPTHSEARTERSRRSQEFPWSGHIGPRGRSKIRLATHGLVELLGEDSRCAVGRVVLRAGRRQGWTRAPIVTASTSECGSDEANQSAYRIPLSPITERTQCRKRISTRIGHSSSRELSCRFCPSWSVAHHWRRSSSARP